MEVGDLVVRAYGHERGKYGIIVVIAPPNDYNDGINFIILWPDGGTSWESEFEVDPVFLSERA